MLDLWTVWWDVGADYRGSKDISCHFRGAAAERPASLFEIRRLSAFFFSPLRPRQFAKGRGESRELTSPAKRAAKSASRTFLCRLGS